MFLQVVDGRLHLKDDEWILKQDTPGTTGQNSVLCEEVLKYVRVNRAQKINRECNHLRRFSDAITTVNAKHDTGGAVNGVSKGWVINRDLIDQPFVFTQSLVKVPKEGDRRGIIHVNYERMKATIPYTFMDNHCLVLSKSLILGLDNTVDRTMDNVASNTKLNV